MPYTMIHIRVAEKVIGYLDAPVDYSTYILGTIAPDAVHASKDYTVALKEASHAFCDGLKWGKVADPADLLKWQASIKDFYSENRGKCDRDFLLGYTVHLLVDVYACERIYAPFYLESKDLPDFDERMAQFKKESYDINYMLYKEYEKEKNLHDVLKGARYCSIENYIDKDLYDPRIEQLYSYEFKERDLSHIRENTICTVENTNALFEDLPGIIALWKGWK